MSQDRAREIAELAHAIADYHFPTAWIDPELVILESDITLSFNDYGDSFDGMIERRNGRFHVYCNLSRVGSRTSARARFTLSHELGHYYIDSHRIALQSGRVPAAHPSFSTNPNAELTVEEEANWFASNLLMPQERVDKIIDPNRNGRELADVLNLANTFKVSRQSAGIRVVESAGPARCAMVMWRSAASPWYRVSPGFRMAGYQNVKLDKDNLPPDSSTRMCVNTISAGKLRKPVETTISTASMWFHGIQMGGRNDSVLREEAIDLGPHGILTFLSPHLLPA
jgi:hypothetical protein